MNASKTVWNAFFGAASDAFEPKVTEPPTCGMFAALPAMLEPSAEDIIDPEDIEASELIPPDDIALPEAGPAGISDEPALVDEDDDVPEPEPQAANSGEAAAPATPAPRMRSRRRRFIAVARS